jgi:hypothetical protein
MSMPQEFDLLLRPQLCWLRSVAKSGFCDNTGWLAML